MATDIPPTDNHGTDGDVDRPNGADSRTGSPVRDPRPDFARSVQVAQALVAAVRLQDLQLPTPCTEFDVRALIGHLVAVLRRIAHVATGGHPFDLPHVARVDGDDWVSAFDEAAVRYRRAWSDDAVLDRRLSLPWGEMPGRAALGAYLGEVTTHSWDLATVIGRTDLLDEALAAQVLPEVRRLLPAQPRGGQVPFGAVVAVADDAPASDRLAGWMGRVVPPRA